MKKYLSLLILIALLISAGCTVTMTPPPQPVATVPAAPTNLQAGAASDTTIALSWTDNSNNEIGFKIYRGETATTVTNLVIQVGAGVTTYTEQGLTPGKTYYYLVTAYNAQGESAPSNTAHATTTEQVVETAPTAPIGLHGIAQSSTAVQLYWTDASDNEIGFRVYRRLSTTVEPVLVGALPADANSYVDQGLTPDTTYYYTVAAYNGVGENSTEVYSVTTLKEVIPTVPAAPNSLSATAQSSTQVVLTWIDGSTDEQGFKIYRGESATSITTLVATVVDNVTSYTDQTVQGGRTYYYQVKSYNTVGMSVPSNTAQVTTPPLPTVPAAPTNLLAQANSPTSVSLNWTDASTDEQGFKIYRGESAGSITTLVATVGANVTSYSDQTVLGGKSYYYQVKSYNTVGISDPSNTVQVTTPTVSTVPAPPTNLQAVVNSESCVSLVWTDSSTDEQGFKIYRSESVDAITTLVAEVGADIETYIDQTLQAGTTYYYQVKAYNSVGVSAPSNTVQVTTPSLPTPPAAPTNLQVVANSPTSVSLNWTDASTDEQGFYIYRGESASTITTNVGLVSANVTNFTDWGVQGGKTYYYQIKAYNTVGSSAPSNTAQITTPTVPAAPTNLQAEAVSVNSVSLTWTDASANEQGFKIFRATSGNSMSYIAAVGAGVTSYTDMSVASSTTYNYEVYAYNAHGFSTPSNTATVITPRVINNAAGQIVNMDGQGIAGIRLTMGAYVTQTAADGTFTFNDISTGSYTLQGTGGDQVRYEVKKSLTISPGENDLGQITVYQALGVGVVIQAAESQSTMQARSTKTAMQSKNLTRKMLDLSDTIIQPGLASLRVKSTRSNGTRVFTNLQQNISFIALQWESLGSWVTQYEIRHYTTDTQYGSVWYSTSSHPEDPTFDPTNPMAYLDLSSELRNRITSAGTYNFEIVAYGVQNGISIAVKIPVRASLGLALDNYPTNLTYYDGSVSWDTVLGAAGYRVRIYDEYDVLVFDSGPTLINAIPLAVPGLTVGAYYTIMVDAQAMDADGWLAEITRGITGFIR